MQSSIYTADIYKLDALVDLYVQFFAEDGITTPRDSIKTNLTAMLQDERAGVFIAVHDDGTLIGLASASLTCGVEFGWAVELEDLFVVPLFRGQGLARRLIREALAWANANGASQVFLVITPEAEAQQSLSILYEKFGFVRSARILMYRSLVQT